MPDEKELLTGFVSKTLNMDESEVASLYNEDGTLKADAKETLLAKDADRIKAIKEAAPSTKAIQDQYLKGKKDGKEELETVVRTTFGIQSTKIGAELISEARAKISEPGTVTEDVVKKHPAFIGMEERLRKEADDKIAAAEARVKEVESNFQTKEQKKELAKTATSILSELKPILPKTQSKADRQVNDFADRITSRKWAEFEKNGVKDYYLLKDDGSPAEDAHGNKQWIKDVVKAEADAFFDFETADNRSAPPDPKKTGANTSTATKPATEAEYISRLAELDQIKDVKERATKKAELIKLYKGQ